MNNITEEIWKSMRKRGYAFALLGAAVAFVSMLFTVAAGAAAGYEAVSMLFAFTTLVAGIMMGYGLLPGDLRAAHERATGKKW